MQKYCLCGGRNIPTWYANAATRNSGVATFKCDKCGTERQQRKRLPKAAPAPREPLPLMWRRDRGTYRVWRSDWVGDQFEVLDWQQFAELERVCKRFSLPLEEAADD